MTLPDLPSRSKAKSLADQIRDSKLQVLIRQQRVETRAAALARNIHQQLTAPATLLLASGIGFIIGELTKCQTRKFPGTGEKCQATETTPLKIALNLLTSVHTLYTALPIAWMVKTFYQQPTCRFKSNARSEGGQENAQTRSRHP